MPVSQTKSFRIVQPGGERAGLRTEAPCRPRGAAGGAWDFDGSDGGSVGLVELKAFGVEFRGS